MDKLAIHIHRTWYHALCRPFTHFWFNETKPQIKGWFSYCAATPSNIPIVHDHTIKVKGWMKWGMKLWWEMLTSQRRAGCNYVNSFHSPFLCGRHRQKQLYYTATSGTCLHMLTPTLLPYWKLCMDKCRLCTKLHCKFTVSQAVVSDSIWHTCFHITKRWP